MQRAYEDAETMFYLVLCIINRIFDRITHLLRKLKKLFIEIDTPQSFQILCANCICNFAERPTLMIVNNKFKKQQNLKYLTNMNDYHEPRNKRNDNQTTGRHVKNEQKCFREYEKETKEKEKKESHKYAKNARNYDRNNAKFSDDQDAPASNLLTPAIFPSLPQLKRQIASKNEAKGKATFNNLAYFTKGTILSIKTCNIEIPTKKFGKTDFTVEILTQQQHKNLITQLFDPGFSSLNIKKDKNQDQIIQYLSQSKKNYRFVVCWLEAVQPCNNEILREVAKETNEKQRIFGWHNDHIKIHIMSLRQLTMIGRFDVPYKYGSKAASTSLQEERMTMIVQYPQRIYEIKEHYHPFSSISRKKQEIPEPVVEKIVETAVESIVEQTFQPIFQQIVEQIEDKSMIASKEPQTQPEAQIQKKQQSTEETNEPKIPFQSEKIKVIYEGWDDANSIEETNNQEEQVNNMGINETTFVSDLPEHIVRIKLHFGIKTMEPILSDEEEEKQEQPDLATELLNSLKDFGRFSPSPVHQTIDQMQQMHGYPQQYGYYDYYQPQYYFPPMENGWNSQMASYEHQSAAYQQYNHNGNYNYPPQYVQSNTEMGPYHINQNYWMPQQEGAYYQQQQGSQQRQEQSHQGGYQY